jgi:hypothetical protein
VQRADEVDEVVHERVLVAEDVAVRPPVRRVRMHRVHRDDRPEALRVARILEREELEPGQRARQVDQVRVDVAVASACPCVRATACARALPRLA